MAVTLRLTNCGATGLNGPTNAQIINEYKGKIEGDYVTYSSVPGVQQIKVRGLCKIQAVGASSIASNQNTTGLGASMYGEFLFEKETTLYILIGQQGLNNPTTNTGTSGGGGGTFVAKSLTSDPLLIAGGGGGCRLASSNTTNVAVAHATIDKNGRNGSSAGGTNGNGGSGANGAGGGGGFTGNGGDSPDTVTYTATGGKSFVNGGIGGVNGGGFGGGGGATNRNDTGGGGGGGYSGGGGWTYNSSPYYAGGGGSYNSGSNQSNQEKYNYGHGYLIITIDETALLNQKYFIIDNGLKYIKNNQLNSIDDTIDNITADTFRELGMMKFEFPSNLLDSNQLSLLVCLVDEELSILKINNPQKIINSDYTALIPGAIIYKMQIVETANSCITKFIFCIDDHWFWYNNENWVEINFNDFDITIGNTSTQINNFTELIWSKFDDIYDKDDNIIFQRKIKICALLSHDLYKTSPIINKINIWCYLPTEALGISTNKYDITNYYDKYEIKWNDATKTSLMIFYDL